MKDINDKVLLVYNPSSGNGMFKNNLDKIISRFQAKGMMVQPVRIDANIKINDVIKNLDESCKKIIAAGGDGTINSVVNALILNDKDIPLAVFPAGTANDFAHYFGIPTDINSMLEIALEDNYVPADVGRYNDRYFVNVAAIGSVIDVSQKTEASVKNVLGIMAYYLKALTELHSLKPVKVEIRTPEMKLSEEIFFMVVLNGNSAGGFRKLGIHSSINDGVLDVIIFKEMPIIEIPILIFDVLHGRHENNDKVIYFQTKKIQIDSEEKISTDIDGETGEPLPLDIEIVDRRIRVNVHKDSVKIDDADTLTEL
ncbi:MAG: YegS/Rv2252/BmrU family lipid kinase [Anaerovoracaceae bacterium]